MLKDNFDSLLVKEEKTFHQKEEEARTLSQVYRVTLQMPKCIAWHGN